MGKNSKKRGKQKKPEKHKLVDAASEVTPVLSGLTEIEAMELCQRACDFSHRKTFLTTMVQKNGSPVEVALCGLLMREIRDIFKEILARRSLNLTDVAIADYLTAKMDGGTNSGQLTKFFQGGQNEPNTWYAKSLKMLDFFFFGSQGPTDGSPVKRWRDSTEQFLFRASEPVPNQRPLKSYFRPERVNCGVPWSIEELRSLVTWISQQKYFGDTLSSTASDGSALTSARIRMIGHPFLFDDKFSASTKRKLKLLEESLVHCSNSGVNIQSTFIETDATTNQTKKRCDEFNQRLNGAAQLAAAISSVKEAAPLTLIHIEVTSPGKIAAIDRAIHLIFRGGLLQSDSSGAEYPLCISLHQDEWEQLERWLLATVAQEPNPPADGGEPSPTHFPTLPSDQPTTPIPDK